MKHEKLKNFKKMENEKKTIQVFTGSLFIKTSLLLILVLSFQNIFTVHPTLPTQNQTTNSVITQPPHTKAPSKLQIYNLLADV